MSLSDERIRMTWFGHSCFKFGINEDSLYFDPVRKNIVLGTTLEPQKETSSIFVSHEHWDHFDAETILTLCTPRTEIYCPRSVVGPLSLRMTFERDSPEEIKKLTGQITPLKRDDIIKINSAKIKCLEASEGLAFLIIHKDKKVLFMGDSVATSEMITEKPDVILFPVWAVKGKEAKLEEFIELSKDSLCMPMHYHTNPDGLPNFYADIQEIQGLLKEVNLKILKKNKMCEI
jgi:L-ascorbate metabolism protein UlaG (beta-lactamase superfamily)